MSSVIVLDDRAPERELLSIVLSHIGHTVLQASTGEEALDLARANPPDLIIADLMMPGMNGYEFVRQLRGDPTVGQTKVVFCTASYDEAEVRKLAETCGVSHTLLKPCEPEEIIRVVGEVLALDSRSPPAIEGKSFKQEELRVLNAKLIQKVDELEAVNREQRQLHEQLRRAQAETAETLTLLETLQSTAPVGFGFVDRGFRIRHLNETLAEINGGPLEEQLGRPVAEIMPDLWPTLGPIYRGVVETGEPVVDQEVQGEVPSAPGEIRDWRASYYPVRMEDRIIGVGVVVIDVTDLKLAVTQALEASRLKSEFMADMSHEIRTPLNGVVVMTELLANTSLDHAQREYADALAASNKALLTVVDDILDYSTLEEKHLALDPTDFDLRAAVSGTCAAFEQQAHAQGLTLGHHVEPDLPVTVTGDELRIGQILSKLLSNAVKFTATGAINVSVARDGGDALRFEVADEGIGIGDAHAARLCDPFVQADGSTTRQYGGTGIGLTIARELVELMNGRIGATSREGGGSVFWFTAELPAAATDQQVRPGSKGSFLSVDGNGGFGTGKRPLALIVEDNAINRAVAEVMLGKRGLCTEVAHDGREAVAMVGENAYAAIFMDCQMPNMDGYEATRCIRAAEQDQHIPIIAMTAHAMPGDRERCLASGMDDYLSKPVKPEALDAAVERWLSPSDTSEVQQTT